MNLRIEFSEDVKKKCKKLYGISSTIDNKCLFRLGKYMMILNIPCLIYNFEFITTSNIHGRYLDIVI